MAARASESWASDSSRSARPARIDAAWPRSSNRPNLGYGYENIMYGFNWTGRNFDIASLRDYWQAGQSVGGITSVVPAGQVVREFAAALRTPAQTA